MKYLIAALLCLIVLIVLALCAINRAELPIGSGPPVPPSYSAGHLLKVTVPKLGIYNVNAYYAPPTSERALKFGLLHVKGTGFPWQKGANVYVAGHDLGFPGTDSWHIFWNLQRLKDGDKIIVRDTNGQRYEYRVYKKLLTGPYDTWVMRPRHNKNIVTLQTCRPHWIWTQRLIVRGELVHTHS